MKKKAKSFLKISFVLIVLTAVLGAGYLILLKTGLWEKFNSPQKLQTLILDLGFWGRFAFVFLQFLQVSLIPIPSPVLIIAGSLIYGPLEAGLLSISGILLGSTLAFALGRIFGKKLVVFMVGKEAEIKWREFLTECKYTFVVMMILPFFPDDILCMVAGLTDMSWNFFMLTQIIIRPISIFLVSYFSSGNIIPYSGWGLIVWALIIILSFLLVYLSKKYSTEIESFIKKIVKRT